MRWLALWTGPRNSSVHSNRRHIEPRNDRVVETLSALRSQGIKIGLISNCGPCAAELWSQTVFHEYFDVSLFSCREGSMKPAADMYLKASKAMLVAPEQFVYVGDGGSCELEGASRLGMLPMLIHVQEEIDREGHSDESAAWTGTSINAIEEILGKI